MVSMRGLEMMEFKTLVLAFYVQTENNILSSYL